MRWLCILISAALAGCVTQNCSLLSGERNTVKSDQDQSPSTKVDGKIPVSLAPK